MDNILIRNRFLRIYTYSMCFYVLAVADVLWLSIFPLSVICAYICIISVIKMSSGTKVVTSGEASLFVIILLYCLFSVVVCKYYFIKELASFLAIISIILLPIKEKLYFFNAITNCFIIILLISIPAWILYLIGIPLPHSNIIYHPNGFHEFYDYYFFRVSSKGFSFFPRFGSIFLEPGQMATPCAFLFFLNGANFNRKNLVLLTAIGLSFSLIAYGLVSFGFLAYRFMSSSKYKVLKILSSLVLVLGVSLYFSQDEVSDDPMSTMIVSRLEYDDEYIISGNNRMSNEFRRKFDVFMQTDDKYWGIHEQLEKGYNWTKSSSGLLKFIVQRGLIGLFLLLLFFFILFWNKRCLATFLWLVILITAFVVRNLLQAPLWCSIAIVGFYLLDRLSNNHTIISKESNVKNRPI